MDEEEKEKRRELQPAIKQFAKAKYFIKALTENLIDAPDLLQEFKSSLIDYIIEVK